MDELKDYSDMFYSFFIGEGAKYYIGIDERDSIPKEEYEDKVFLDFVDYAMKYAKQNRKKKFIIDGIWIYLYFDDPSKFEDYAVFIKGTSFLKSIIRVMKREMQRDKADTVFREEQDESAMIKALNGIDKCFVNEDANGLLEIIKDAKENSLLSNWEKQMVAHECKSAVLDLFD